MIRKTTVKNISTARFNENAVNIMRPTKWGNPSKLIDYTKRDECIAQFRAYFYADTPHSNKLREDAIKELQGKELICCCYPLPCHGDIIADYVNNSHNLL